MNEADLWFRFPFAYLFTILIEAPILMLGLSPKHPWKAKLLAGIWLTACTYPIVWLVLPQLFDLQRERTTYLIVAETFAPIAECVLFWLAWGDGKSKWRDWSVIVLANLVSFLLGEVTHEWFAQLLALLS